MRKQWAWLGVSLLILGGLGLWLLRGPLRDRAGAGAPDADPAGSASIEPGTAEAHAGPDAQAENPTLLADPRDSRPEPGSVDLPENVPGPAELLPAAGGWSFLYRAPSGNAHKSQRDAWERLVAPLVYPPDHPRAGQYREGVTLQEAVDARLEYAKSIFPEDELHRPYHHIVKQISYPTVNKLAEGWKAQDLASGDEYARRLRETPSEPGAREQNLWIPGSPSDPQTTTTAEIMEKALINLEAPAFIRPRT
jgi:hypothetical protein